MNIATTLAAVVAMGISALWLAWILKIPAIIILLGFGFIAGPLTGFINPDVIMGDLFQPFVSLSVGLIMFEGGLSLKYRDIKSERPVLINLLTTGVLLTWIFVAVSAALFTGIDWPIAFLVGAILTVTGPTVIIPLLKHIKLTGKVGAILKWEGITIDPVGASLSVLVFEVIRAGGAGFSYREIIYAIFMTIAAGGISGALAAGFIILAMKKYWVPDFLQGVFTLMIVFGVFVISNHFQHESGLLGVTVMGIILANQKKVSMKHIIEFKENLTLILVSLLFILLSARLKIEDFSYLGPGAFIFVLSVIFIVRPLSVYFSTMKSGLSRKEKIFLAFIAPRGIVAASVASVFGLELAAVSYPGASHITAIVFMVIISTVLFYGFFSPFLAKKLGLVNPDPQGVLIAGAGAFSRAIASALTKEGFDTILVDTNMSNVTAAKMDGLSASVGSILSDHFMELIELGNAKRIICLTPNDEMNALACQKFRQTFGSRETYQLAYVEGTRFEAIASEHRGRILFRKDMTSENLSRLCGDKPQVKITGLSEDFNYDDFIKLNQKTVVPLFISRKNGHLDVFTVDEVLKPMPKDKIISLSIVLNDGEQNL